MAAEARRSLSLTLHVQSENSEGQKLLPSFLSFDLV